MTTMITDKVSSETLNLMLDNFIKMSSWAAQGTQSQYPMPQPLSEVYMAAQKVAELDTEVTGLGYNVEQLTQALKASNKKIAELEQSIASVSSVLNETVEMLKAVVAPQEQVQPVAPVAPVAQAPIVEQSQPALIDLGNVAQAPVAQAPVAQAPVAQAPVAQAPVAQAPIEVSAQAINAGDLDPTSYAALDAEISKLVGK